MDAYKLILKERAEALSSLIFITNKRDGIIKARKCAVGSKQKSI